MQKTFNARAQRRKGATRDFEQEITEATEKNEEDTVGRKKVLGAATRSLRETVSEGFRA